MWFNEWCRTMRGERCGSLQAHYGTLLRLKQYFPFSLIDAMGSLDECRQQIAREMRYQSSMDLDEATYAAIRHLPLARELVRTSRQQLVSHLDTYCKKHHAIFLEVGPPPPLSSTMLPGRGRSSLPKGSLSARSVAPACCAWRGSIYHFTGLKARSLAFAQQTTAPAC